MRASRIWRHLGLGVFALGVGVICAMALGVATAQAAEPEVAADTMPWVMALGNSQSKHADAVAVNPNGESAVVGNFRGTVDFDPGSGEFLLSSDQDGTFIALYAVTGTLIWAQVIQGDEDVRARDVIFDKLGYVVVVGGYKGSADFDPGPERVQRESDDGSEDLFIARYHRYGGLDWVYTAGDSDSDRVESIAVDHNNHYYVTGSFEGIVPLDPPPSKIVLEGEGDNDIFVARINPHSDEDDRVMWAKGIGSDGEDVGTSIGVDANSNVYVVGTFEDNIDLDPGFTGSEFTSSGKEDIFVTVLNYIGDWVWSTKFGGRESERQPHIVVESGGTFYVTGSFEGQTDFDFQGPNSTDTSGLVTSRGESDIFLVKYDRVRRFGWVFGLGTPLTDDGNAIARDALGYIYITGEFEGSMDVDPASGAQTILTSQGKDDIFVAKYTSQGTLRQAQVISGAEDEESSDLTVDQDGNVLMVGDYQGTLDFGGGMSITAQSSTEVYDMFIAKLSADVWTPGRAELYIPSIPRGVDVQ